MRDITFRGNFDKKNYFEGWYFKAVDEVENIIVILIPGISLFKKKFAFLQYIIYHKGESFQGFLEYPLEKFLIKKPFSLHFPDGFISKHRIALSLKQFKIDLQLSDFTPLQTSILNPSIMGFFEYLKMPCYHDIVSLSHKVTGSVQLNHITIPFQGKGYIEGDRGKSFPDYYLWAQCNHFENTNASFFFSVADIRLPFFRFLGHIAVFSIQGKQYRFATYLGSKIFVKVSTDKTEAMVILKSRKHQLSFKLKLNQGNDLIAPMNHSMDFKMKEQVKSDLLLKFDDKLFKSHFCAGELVNWR